MSYSKIDVIKLIALALFLGVFTYSALVKFVFVESNSTVIIIQPDYRYCDTIQTCEKCYDKEGLLQLCHSDIDKAFDDANTKCKGYLQNLSTCKSSQRSRQSQCRVGIANVEGCVTSVTADVVKKWLDPSSVVILQ